MTNLCEMPEWQAQRLPVIVLNFLILFNYINIYFPVSVPVSSITVELFLLGGSNWFETKPIDAEKLAIRKLYKASRESKLSLNLNAIETACAIRK